MPTRRRDGLVSITVHGARGSVAVGGVAFERYGGATICLAAKLEPDHFLVLDAGTGIREFQRSLPDDRPLRFTFLLSHYHWDHLLGLPFFGPLYEEHHRFDFYGHSAEHYSLERSISGVFHPPWFPVPLQDTPSTKKYHDVGDDSWLVGRVAVTATRLHHPQGVTAYRIESDDRSLVFATDVEAGEPASDARLTELASGGSVLIHDAQYLPDEYRGHLGWGHSTWEHAVDAAERAGVGRLILISHDPDRTDDGVDALLAAARERFPNTDAAFPGMQLEV